MTATLTPIDLTTKTALADWFALAPTWTTELPYSLVIPVIDEDIAEGVARSAFDCPLARAIKRALPGLHAHVGNTLFQVFTGRCMGGDTFHCEQVGIYEFDEDANSFVARFDREQSVQPFTFRAKRVR